jgi:hypothetical protein
MECERARLRVSLRLDGELSQLGQALLRAHVGRCALCAEFDRDLDALTLEIRRAPLLRPSRATLPVRRRSTGRRVLQVSVAALGSLVGSHSSPDRAGDETAVQVVSGTSLSTVATARPGTRLHPPLAV